MTQPARIEKPVAEMSEDEFDAWLCALPPPPHLPTTDDDVAESDARALADLEAGRTYSQDEIAGWLKAWGKPYRKPIEEWLAARHG